MAKKQGANCEYCVNYSYDDDYECYTCEMNLDEDEMYRFVTGTYRDCPYFRMGDEYRVVRKQMQESKKLKKLLTYKNKRDIVLQNAAEDSRCRRA